MSADYIPGAADLMSGSKPRAVYSPLHPGLQDVFLVNSGGDVWDHVRHIQIGVWGLVLIVLALAYPSSTFAQPNFGVKQLDASTGLSHDAYNAFFGTDSRGFHWIGSTQGAYRYDGRTLKHYPLENRSAKTSGLIQSNFFEDQAGNVWTTTANALLRYDWKTDSMSVYDVPGRAAKPDLSLHIFDYVVEGDYFLISDSDSTWRFSATAPTTLRESAKTSSIRYLTLNQAEPRTYLGFPWLLSTGMERLTLGKEGRLTASFSTDSLIQASTISNGVIAEDGTVWLASDGGLIAYDPTSDRAEALYQIPDVGYRRVWSLTRVGSFLLVATGGSNGWWFDLRSRAFTQQLDLRVSAQKEQPPRPRLYHQSPEGVIFVMQSSPGLQVLVPQQLQVSSPRYENRTKVKALSIFHTVDGDTWLLNAQGEILGIPAGQETVKEVFQTGKFPNSRIRAFAQTQDGTVWAVVRNTLFSRKSAPGVEWSILKTQNEFVYGVFADPLEDEKPYVHTKRGLFRLTGKKLEAVQGWSKEASSLQELYPLGESTYAYSSDDSWLRLIRLQNGSATYIDSLQKSKEVLSCSYIKSKNQLLIGTVSGLLRAYKTDENNWTIAPAELSVLSIEALATVDTSLILALGNQGLAIKRSNEDWLFVTEEDGIAGGSGHPGALALSLNRVWMSTRAGASILPMPIQRGVKSPASLYVNQLFVNDRPIQFADWSATTPLTLAYSERSIKLKLGSVKLYEEEPPTLRYRLTGIDTSWATQPLSETIQLARLPYGAFTFEAELIDQRGRRSTPVHLAVFIQRPYWATWWFALLVLLTLSTLVGGAVFSIYQRKLARQQRALERQTMLANERDRIARELHDDLGGGLASILFLSELEPQDFTDEIKVKIKGLSRNALKNMREIVWTLDQEDECLTILVERICSHAKTLCEAHGVQFSVLGVEHIDAQAYHVSGVFQRGTLLLISEAVTNAVRHGKPSCVELSFRCDKTRRLLISVRDDGIGFDPVEVRTGIGLKSMRRRAEDLSGTLSLSSPKDQGTLVETVLPLNA